MYDAVKTTVYISCLGFLKHFTALLQKKFLQIYIITPKYAYFKIVQ
jgi:hypothetical protein